MSEQIKVEMPYTEYEQMKRTIEEQKLAIEQLKDDKDIIILDEKWGYGHTFQVPQVVKGEEKVKKLLGEIFENFKRDVERLYEIREELRKENKKRLLR